MACGCKLSVCFMVKETAKKSGYGAVKYKCPGSGERRVITAHRPCFMVTQEQIDLGANDVSHHNGLCVRIDHLTAEPMKSTTSDRNVSVADRLALLETVLFRIVLKRQNKQYKYVYHNIPSRKCTCLCT